ncbi:uncharacterized protein LOC144420770 [Styela clava]
MADKSKWAGKNLSYMTPQMMHAMKMSQTQSQNTYKKQWNTEIKGKGRAGVETIESERAKKMTAEQSLLKYHKDFEQSKSKGYTATTETPELERIRRLQTSRDVRSQIVVLSFITDHFFKPSLFCYFLTLIFADYDHRYSRDATSTES